MRNKTFAYPPINITCPYCGQLTHMPQPNMDDADYLMDEDCNSCGERIFATFKFIPQLTEVYRLVPSGIKDGKPIGKILEPVHVAS